MKKSFRYASTWVFCMFMVNTFVFPWLGLSNDPSDFETITGKLIIWMTAGTIIFFMKEHERKKQLKAQHKK